MVYESLYYIYAYKIQLDTYLALGSGIGWMLTG